MTAEETCQEIHRLVTEELGPALERFGEALGRLAQEVLAAAETLEGK